MKIISTNFTLVFAFFLASMLPVQLMAQCQDFSVSVNEPTFYTYCENEIIPLTATPSGGTPPYTYAWSTGGTGQTENIPAQNTQYLVSVTDANGCVAFAAAHLKPIVADVNAFQSGSVCEGEAAELVIFLSPNHDILWSTGETSQVIFVTTPGVYGVTITHPIYGCTAWDTVSPYWRPITIPDIAGPTSLCEGQNGTLTLEGGTFYNITWAPNGETTEQITINSPGTYSVTVTNEFNCTATNSIEVLPTQLTPPLLTGDQIICPGGTANISVSNSSEYTGFQWSNGSNSSSVVVNQPGDYTVTVSDVTGCTTTGSFTVIVDPNLPTASANAQSEICGQGNGSINLVVSPPTGNTYAWSNGMTTEDLIDLQSGFYIVTITSVAGCTATADALVSDLLLPINILGNVSPNTSCTGANGSIDISIAPPGNYNFSWSNGMTTEDIQALAPGNYSVTATLGFTCAATETFQVADNSQISLDATVATNNSCQTPNGAIDLTITPSGNYTISWSNGASTEDIQNLPGGNYTVTVIGFGGCNASATYEIVSSAGAPTTQITATPASCSQENGSIDLSVSPTGNYTFAWSNGSSTEDLQNLAAGAYSVTVTGGNGCSTSVSAEIVADNSPGFSLAANSSPNTSCTAANGSIDLTTSPTGNYSFAWSNGASTEDLQNLASGNYTVTVTATNGGCTGTATYVVENATAATATATPSAASCGQANGSVMLNLTPAGTYTYLWSNGSTAANLLNVPAGVYGVTVTTASGCTTTALATVINNNSNLNLSAIPSPNTTCSIANGAIDLTASPSGIYTFAWSNGASTEDLQNLPGGNYMVTVTDADNCTSTATFTVPDNSGAPSLTATPNPSTCGNNDGSITLTTSPAGNYGFLWSNGSTTANLQNLAAGLYTVTVTDANNCSAVSAATVASDTLDFTVNANVTPNSSCTANDGAISLSVTPAGNYFYSWANGANMSDLENLAPGSYEVTVSAGIACSITATYLVADNSASPVLNPTINASDCGQANGGIALTVNPPAGNSFLWSNAATTQNLQNLTEGNYAVTVTAANGCTATGSYSVPGQSANISITGTASGNASCLLPNGAIDLTVSSVANYQVNWSNGATNEDLSGLPTGNYSVTVMDSNGCSESAGFTILGPAQPQASISGPASVCEGLTATLSANLGFASYSWSNGAITAGIEASQTGVYGVTVTDANGCTALAEMDFQALSLPAPVITGPTSICSGSATFNVTGGSFQQILWSTGAASTGINVSQAGTYIVTVTGANGCTASGSQTLSIGAGLNPDISATLTDCNGTYTLDAGSNWTSYLWSNGSTAASISVTGSGNYFVTVSDASGCTGTASETVSPTLPPFVQIAGAANLCQGDQTTLATPGNFVQYLWTTGDTTSQINITQGGNYGVTVSDANGCTASDAWTVVQLYSDSVQVQATTCFVQDTGTVAVVLSNVYGCDSTVITTTSLTPVFTTQVSLSACEGENVSYNGVVLPAGSSHSFVYVSADGCDSLVEVQVTALPAVDFTLSTESSCPNLSNGKIEVLINSGTLPYQFVLDGGFPQTNPTFEGLSSGNYTVLVQDANGCASELEITVPESLPLDVLTQIDTLHCASGQTTLRPILLSGNPDEVLWTWPDGSHQPWWTVTEAGTYSVQIQDACETIERSIQVVWEEEYGASDFFYIPNSFSPNGDGINDEFQAFPGRDFELVSFELRVFDRWGNALFMATDPNTGWDGLNRSTELQAAVYGWFVKATVIGCGERKMEVFRKGDLTIIR